MKLSDLEATHPSYDSDRWGDYRALYAGGAAFDERAGRFLPQNANEPAQRYARRLAKAHYRSYIGPIVDLFGSWLFTAQIDVRARSGESGEAIETPEFYSDWKEEVSGCDEDLATFTRARFTDSLIEGAAFWLVEMPDDSGLAPASRAEWEERELGRAKLKPISRDQLLDWEEDSSGSLLWANLYDCRLVRPSITSGKRLTQKTWTLYDSSNVSTYQVTYDPKERELKADDIIPLVGVKPHSFGEVPLVRMEIKPIGLWIANRVASAQVAHFQLSNAQTWGIEQTCYAMPVLFLDEAREGGNLMGPGYYLQLGAKDRFEWSAPPAVPFEQIGEAIKSHKDEIFRIVHQMAAGVDNNAAAVGRSGRSKELDASSTQVILRAYGDMVKRALEETYELISRARGEALDWSIEGLERFELDVDMEQIIAAMAGLSSVRSETFKKELEKRAAFAVLPNVAQTVKDLISDEIDSAEEVLPPDTALGSQPKDSDAEHRNGPGATGPER